MRDISEVLSLSGVIITSDEAAFEKIAGAATSVGLKLKRIEARNAAAELAHRKVQAVIIDCRESSAQETIAQLRMQGSNRHIVVFALASDSAMSRAAHAMGANFVLDVPIRSEAALRCFRAARGLMIAEYRRYLRVPSDGIATVALNAGENVAVRVSNLSVGGMAITADVARRLPNHFNIRFVLGEHRRLDLAAQVVWRNGRGEYGLLFVRPTASEREALLSWVESRHVSVNQLVAAQVVA